MSDLPNDFELLEDAEPRPLVLPPPYSPRRIEAGDVLAEALRLAPEEGAGTLVWRHGGGILAFAVVLEPEQPLASARMAFFAGMCALEIERLVGKQRHRVNYRHVVHSLVRKPGAFARYRYREDLYPSVTFRRAYDALVRTRGVRADWRGADDQRRLA